MDLSPLNKLTNNIPFSDTFVTMDETDDFLIILKKHGVAVQATDAEQEDLEKILKSKYNTPIFVLNRIDQPVTGLVVFGKSKEFTEAFTELLKERKVKKTYLAIVAGNPKAEPTELRHFLKKLHNRAMSADVQVDHHYKEAVLTYSLLQSFDNYHLLKVDLETGRFHQIRAQLATMEMPIKGDLKYGSRRPNLDRSICLLSYQLEFDHPFTGKTYRYEAPLPSNDVLWGLVDLALIK
ncbi:MAG: RNA pseudouridine synthase [Saprospiraceae bacterium]